MHVIRYFVRGYLLFALGFFIPDGVELYVSEHAEEFPQGLTVWPSVGLFFTGILFIFFSAGQFQYAYRFKRLGDVLKKTVVGKKPYRFVTLNGDDGTATHYHGGFQIEITPHGSFDKIVYIVLRRELYAHKQVVVGLAERVQSDGSLTNASVLLESVMLSPDYKNEMKSLVHALESRSSR